MADSPLDDLLVKPLGAEHGPLIERPGRQSSDPLADLEVAPTLGGESTSRRPNIYSRAIRRNLRERWQRRSTGEAVGARALNMVNSIPIVGEALIPENNSLIQEFQAANPTESFLERSLTRSVPYAAAGRALGTMPRATVGGATIEGADAFTRGDDPIMAAMTGAAFGTLGNIAPRAITPRNRRAIDEEWRGISRNARKVAEDEYDKMVRSNRFYVYRDPALARSFATMAGAHGGRNPTQMPSIDRSLDRQHYIRDTIREYRNLWEQGHIPTADAGSFTRTVAPSRESGPFLTGMSNVNPWISSAGAAATGFMLGHNPLLYGAAGLLSGPAAAAGKKTTERVINSRPFNLWYSNTMVPESARHAIQAGAQGTGPEYLHDRTQTLMGDNMPTLSTEDIIRALRGQ